MMKRILAIALLFACSAANAQFTTGQLLTAAQLNTAFAAVLPLAGGTLTGPLVAPSATFTSPLGFASGGTGATSQAAALAGLLGSSAVPIANGGTNATTATGATSQLQYLQGGTGSVARSLTNKLQDTVSAFDFMNGAQIANVQSGAASVDVTTALQACINYVASLPRGGTCWLPPGEYLISATLTNTTPYVRIAGSGELTSVLVTTTNIQDILIGTNPITALPGVDVVDIGFYHTNAVAKTLPDLVMISAIQSTVRCWFQNGAYGLALYGGQGIKLDRIYAPGNYNPTSNPTLNSAQAISLFAASTLAGYSMGTGAVNLPTEIEISSPYITGPSMQGWEYGIAILAGEHVTLDGVYYVGQSTEDNVHIEQDSNNQLILETTLAPGGYIDAAGRAGVWVGGPNGNGSEYIGQTAILGTVKGQAGTGLDGIYFDGTNRGGAYPQAAINSTLAPTEVSGWSRHGMNLQGGTNINIPSPNVFGNSFSTVGNGDGIVIGAATTGVRVSGGKVGGGTYGAGTGNQAFGITWVTGASNVVLFGVDLRGNQAPLSQGTQAAGTTGNRVINCPGFSEDRPSISPTLPASTVAFPNPYGSQAQVLIYNGTVTGISLNGQQMFSNAPGVPISVGPGDVISITYSSAPTWIWWPQ
jgi:hypothetical protein